MQSTSGYWRLYYTYFTTYFQLAFRQTTDTASPHDFLTPPAYLPFNANSNLGFKVSQKPDASGWRFYETGYNGTYIKIRYWDTTDANPPEATNIGGTSTEDAASPEVLQLPNGRYRLYYHYRPGSGYFQLAYRDMSDANLPDATNLGSLQLLGVEGGTINALSPELLLTDSGFYRMYYSISSSPSYYRELVFRDTNDGDPPTSY